MRFDHIRPSIPPNPTRLGRHLGCAPLNRFSEEPFGVTDA